MRVAITNHGNTLDNAVQILSGTMAAIPAASLAGRRYYATDVGIELWDTGSSWIPTGPALPVGAMALWTINSDPVDPDGVTRWVVADGRGLSRTTYAALNARFAAVGYPYGNGNGATTFAIPDTRARVIVGPDTGVGTGAAGRVASNNTIAAASGTETQTLTKSQMPVHGHGNATGGGTTGTDFPDHAHLYSALWDFNGGGGAGFDAGGTGQAGSTGVAHMFMMSNIGTSGATARHAHGVPALAIGDDGGGTSHPNMQPYLVAHHIIRVL